MVKVKYNEDDTIGDLKKLVAAQTRTKIGNVWILRILSQFEVLLVLIREFDLMG